MGAKKKQRNLVHQRHWVRWYDAADNRVSKDTPGAVKKVEMSDAWYAWIGGVRVKLDAASETRAKEECVRRRREHEDAKDGTGGQYRRHLKRPLADHLADWTVSLRQLDAGEQ